MRTRALTAATALCWAAAGCASGRYYDRDRSDPAYYAAAPAIAGMPVQAAQVPGSPTPGADAPANPYVAQDAASAAVLGTVAGAALAAHPDYYRDSAIRGQCMFRSSASDPFEMPCANVVLVLTDLEGREVARAQTNPQGNFGFFVKKGGKYRVHPLSTRYAAEPERPGPLEMGDQLLLHLVLKAGKSEKM